MSTRLVLILCHVVVGSLALESIWGSRWLAKNFPELPVRDINAPGVNNVFTKEELEILERNENPAGPLGEKVHLFKIRLNDTFESLSSPANNFITLLALKVLGELTDDYKNFFDFILGDNYKIPDNNESIMREIIKFGVEEYGKLGTSVKEELEQKFPIVVDVLNDPTFREHYAEALGLPTLAPSTTTTTTRASRLRF